MGKAKPFEPFCKLFSIEFLRQLGNSDIGRVDDDILCADHMKGMLIHNRFSSHRKASVMAVNHIVRVDKSTVKQERKDNGFYNRSRFKAVFNGIGI